MLRILNRWSATSRVINLTVDFSVLYQIVHDRGCALARPLPSGFNSGFRRNSLQYIPETLPKDRFPCSAVSYRYWNDRTVPMPL